MLRAFIAFAVFTALAMPTQAEMIVFAINRSDVGNIPMPPRPISMFVQPNTGGILANFTVANDVDSDDLIHILDEDISSLRRSWLITEANASDYGLDWTAFESAINGPRKEVRVAFGSAEAIFPQVTPPGLWLAGFQMERIELSLHYWFWHPIFPTLRAFSWESRIIGEGRIVPETNPIALAMSGMLAVAVCRFAIRAFAGGSATKKCSTSGTCHTSRGTPKTSSDDCREYFPRQSSENRPHERCTPANRHDAGCGGVGDNLGFDVDVMAN